MFSFCMNLMYVIRCKLCFILDCVFFYKLNTYCVVYPAVTGELSKSVATVDSSSNGWMTSACSSLLGATVVTNVFCTSLLSYHCSDELVARDHNNLWFVATVTDRSSVPKPRQSLILLAGRSWLSAASANFAYYRFAWPSHWLVEGNLKKQVTWFVA
jgi:hypothetical protein